MGEKKEADEEDATVTISLTLPSDVEPVKDVAPPPQFRRVISAKDRARVEERILSRSTRVDYIPAPPAPLTMLSTVSTRATTQESYAPSAPQPSGKSPISAVGTSVTSLLSTKYPISAKAAAIKRKLEDAQAFHDAQREHDLKEQLLEQRRKPLAAPTSSSEEIPRKEFSALLSYKRAAEHRKSLKPEFRAASRKPGVASKGKALELAREMASLAREEAASRSVVQGSRAERGAWFDAGHATAVAVALKKAEKYERERMRLTEAINTAVAEAVHPVVEGLQTSLADKVANRFGVDQDIAHRLVRQFEQGVGSEPNVHDMVELGIDRKVARELREFVKLAHKK